MSISQPLTTTAFSAFLIENTEFGMFITDWFDCILGLVYVLHLAHVLHANAYDSSLDMHISLFNSVQFYVLEFLTIDIAPNLLYRNSDINLDLDL